MLTEDDQERIALISAGCNLTQSDAERQYEAMNKSNPFEGLEARVKQRKIENKMHKNLKRDNKSKASGD